MSNTDGTYTCDFTGCECEVADDQTHIKSEDGQIYCCKGCRDGRGCSHPGCDCANQ